MHINAQPLEHRQVCVTWCGLVHVELAGYQNLQDLNQRIQTRLRPEHRDTTSSVLLTKWVKGFLCFILLIIINHHTFCECGLKYVHVPGPASS